MMSLVDQPVVEFLESLGVRTAGEGPTLYDLLDLEPYQEASPDQLDAALARRSLQLRESCPDEDVRTALMQEFISARQRLAAPASKKQYDRQLRRSELLKPASDALFQAPPEADACPTASSAAPAASLSPAPQAAPPREPQPSTHSPSARDIPADSDRAKVADGGFSSAREAAAPSSLTASAPASPPASPPAPANDDRYELLDEIGRGKNSVVYEAYDRSLRRYVAIKQLNPQLRADRRKWDLFWREAQFLASLQHERVVRIYDVAQERGWIVMERMQSDLRGHVAQSMPPDQLRGVLRHALEGLAFLHQRNQIHGEIKPASLLVDESGNLKISESPGFSAEGEFRLPGSQRHVAPELLNPRRFGEVGPAVDLYCLGFTALELLLGSKLQERFKGVPRGAESDDLRWMRWHSSPSESVPPVEEMAPEVPADLARVINRLVQKQVQDRYGSASEALADLGREPVRSLAGSASDSSAAATSAQGQVGSAAPWRQRWESLRSFAARRPGLLWGLVAMLVIFAFLVLSGGNSETGPQAQVVTIECNPPNAELLLDGEPLTLNEGGTARILPGKHMLEGRLAGHEPDKKDFEVAADPPSQPIQLRLEPIVSTMPVEINSSPEGAQIVVDGKPFDGPTPNSLNLTIGEHRIQLRLPNHDPADIPYIVQARQNNSIHHPFRKALLELVIESKPPGAAITLDEKPSDKKLTTPARIRLPAGPHQIRGQLDGYGSVTQSIQLIANGQKVELALPRLPSVRLGERLVLIDTDPPGAEVLVDGKVWGVTPIRKSLPDGTHRVELRHKDYLPIRKTVKISPDMVKLTFSFAQESKRHPDPVAGDKDKRRGKIPYPVIVDPALELREMRRSPATEGMYVAMLGEILDLMDDPEFREVAEALKKGMSVRDRALRISSKDPRAYYANGLLLEKHNRTQEAADEYEKAIDLSRAPFFAPHRRLIWLRAAKGKYARLDLAEALALDLIRKAVAYAKEPGDDRDVKERILSRQVEFTARLFAYTKAAAEFRGRRSTVDRNIARVLKMISADEFRLDHADLFQRVLNELTTRYESDRDSEKAETSRRRQAVKGSYLWEHFSLKETRNRSPGHRPRSPGPISMKNPQRDGQDLYPEGVASPEIDPPNQADAGFLPRPNPPYLRRRTRDKISRDIFRRYKDRSRYAKAYKYSVTLSNYLPRNLEVDAADLLEAVAEAKAEKVSLIGT